MYKIQYGGKKGKAINLVESPDLVAIRTKKARTSKACTFLRAAAGSCRRSNRSANSRSGCDRRENEGRHYLAGLEMRDATRAALKEEDGVKFAGRVLQDEKTGAFMLYTENFFVKFKDDVAEARCED